MPRMDKGGLVEVALVVGAMFGPPRDCRYDGEQLTYVAK
jgi:hypothetical protein